MVHVPKKEKNNVGLLILFMMFFGTGIPIYILAIVSRLFLVIVRYQLLIKGFLYLKDVVEMLHEKYQDISQR